MHQSSSFSRREPLQTVDGRSLSAPLAWYHRLLNGTPTERANLRLIGSGEGIHWPELDEDILWKEF